jgi:hypothetical protein
VKALEDVEPYVAEEGKREKAGWKKALYRNL